MPRRSARLAVPLPKQFHTGEALGTIYTEPSPAAVTKASATSDEDGGEDTTPSDDKFSDVFRFLDLPPEIRNRIYSYNLAMSSKQQPSSTGEVSRNLCRFRFPAITLTSKQLRRESIPVLFAENHFFAHVCSNYRGPLKKLELSDSYYYLNSEWHLAGNLRFEPQVENFFEAVGDLALFRNVTLRVYNRSFMGHLWQFPWKSSVQELQESDKLTGALLDLKFEGGKLLTSIKDGRFHPRRPQFRRPGMTTAGEVDGALEKAADVAREIASRDGFKGFKIDDLKDVAMALRIE